MLCFVPREEPKKGIMDYKFNKSMIRGITFPETKLFIYEKEGFYHLDNYTIIFLSDILEKRESTKIGLLFVNNPFLPDSKIGVTLAVFTFAGKILRTSDSLKVFNND